MERKSGVLMHISSLWGDYSIGGLGKSAEEFIDFLQECGFSYWQVLPFCVTDEFNSPYASYSAFSLNPYFIDLDVLYSKGFITKNELDGQKQQTPYSCEYSFLHQSRIDLLYKAALRAENKAEIEEYISKKPYIEKFCEFMGRKSANDNRAWYEWENGKEDEAVTFMWKFIEYEFLCEWEEIRKYANNKGIKIIGDIPIYVSLDSSDVWSRPDLFMLDRENKPKCVAGVPPDYFCPDGQLWGNPIYNWGMMKKDGYSWWCDRLKHNLELFDGVRLDHFRGFESYWSVEADEETARNGKWVKGPGISLMKKFRELAGDKLIIAEDLGDITDDVRRLVEKSGFPGMNVFQFGFFGDTKSNHMPHNYKKNSVSYSGTHDNNTLLGYLWELDDSTRKYMLSYCGYESEDWERGFDSMLRAIFRSHSDLVIFPIQDLLGYGNDTRLNVPGRADGNWQFRITKNQLDCIDKHKFMRLNELYGRK